MAVEKLVVYQKPPLSIVDPLAHALIREGFSLIELDRKKGFISATVAALKYLQNVAIAVYPVTEGSLVRILCTARPETSVPGLEGGDFEGGGAFDGPCRRTLDIILTRVEGWYEVSRKWVEEHGIQLEQPLPSRQRTQALLAKFGLWGGLAAIIAGSLMAYLTLSERLMLASPQVWIMTAVIGVLIFCLGLFSLIWRR